MKILITGGAGYIGSHTAVELIEAGHSLVVVDSLVNSHRGVIDKIKSITKTTVPFYKFDLRDKSKVDKLFEQYTFDAIVHFAGLKSVGESVDNPLEYYSNNIGSTLVVLEVAQKYGVNKFVFSSSATVYGDAKDLPVEESSPTGDGITNPYGKTKYFIEQMLSDVCATNSSFEATILRYFNPVGAHESVLIGERPAGIPNNIMPYISLVAADKLDKVHIFGNDYNTPDGTGIRDYIHVVDLAKGHVAALDNSRPGFNVYNLGTGKGTSVLELINNFEQATGKKIPYEIVKRRPGDIAISYASPIKANKELCWVAEKTIAEICKDAWRWQNDNPKQSK